MPNLKYEKELIQALTQLSKIQDDEARLTNEKEAIRQSIKQWLIINDLTSFTAVDLNNQTWSLLLSEQVKTILDKKVAEEILPENVFNKLIKLKKVEVFRCQKVNSSTKDSTKKMPTAPSQTYRKR